VLLRFILKRLEVHESSFFEGIEAVPDEELEFDDFMSEVEEDYSKYYVDIGKKHF
jgi:hypothetical protein